MRSAGFFLRLGENRVGWGQDGREVSPAHPGQSSQAGLGPAQAARRHTCSRGSEKKGLTCPGGFQGQSGIMVPTTETGPSFFASWSVSFLISIVT